MDSIMALKFSCLGDEIVFIQIRNVIPRKM